MGSSQLYSELDMGRRPDEIIKDTVLMLDVKLTEKDKEGYVRIKASTLAELTQALRDKGLFY